MKWAELEVKTTREAVEAVSNILHEAGADGVVIEDPKIVPEVDEDEIWENPESAVNIAKASLLDQVIVKAYLVADEKLAGKVEEINERINLLSSYGFTTLEEDLTVTRLDEKSWEEAWKDYYYPVTVGRITIRPTWRSYQTDNPEEIVIDLDPGMAFGTGTHPSTKMCLLYMQELLAEGYIVSDLGCGSGILSIASAKLGAKKVFAFDLDSVACKVTTENLWLNNVQDKVEVENLDARKTKKHEMPKSNLVLANIVADVIIDLIPTAREMLMQPGYLIVSGIVGSKVDRVLKAAEQNNMEIFKRQEDKNWHTLVLVKSDG